jgi:hypothetical protein
MPGDEPLVHVIEPAPTGRAKCRGCGGQIAAKALRFGEKRPNPFGEGEATQWFHVECAAYKRPEPFLATLEATTPALENAGELAAAAELGVAHPRLPRLNGAERAPSGRAACRHCRTNIEKGAWRFSLVFFEEGTFQPSGFIHVPCAAAYFETAEVLPRVKHFSPALTEEELGEIAVALGKAG